MARLMRRSIAAMLVVCIAATVSVFAVLSTENTPRLIPASVTAPPAPSVALAAPAIAFFEPTATPTPTSAAFSPSSTPTIALLASLPAPPPSPTVSPTPSPTPAPPPTEPPVTPPILDTNPLPDAIAGTPYRAAIRATGGTPPYVYALTTGRLPAGLALSSDGTLAGVPVPDAGVSVFTVAATDRAGTTAARVYTLTVTIPNRATGGGIALSAPTRTVAGGAVTLTVTVRDRTGEIAPGFAGRVTFRSSDPAATLPAPYTFTAADAGSHPFALTLNTAGVQHLFAIPDPSGYATGTADIAVSPVVIGLSATDSPTAGGQTVRIAGIGLGGEMPQVTFGGTPATVIEATSGGLVVTTPPHPAGAVNVVVTVGGLPVSVAGQYTYRAP